MTQDHMIQGQLLQDLMVLDQMWKNILSQIHVCSRIKFEIHTAPGACSKYAPGAVWIQIMCLQHFWLYRIFFQRDGLRPYSPVVAAFRIIWYKSRPKWLKIMEYSEAFLVPTHVHIIHMCQLIFRTALHNALTIHSMYKLFCINSWCKEILCLSIWSYHVIALKITVFNTNCFIMVPLSLAFK